MNAKKVNWIFLAMVLLNITLVVLLLVMYPVFQLGIVANLIVSQIIILVPALIGVLAGRENLIEFAGFRKFKISSALMTVLFTFLFMPLVTLINIRYPLFRYIYLDGNPGANERRTGMQGDCLPWI